MFNMKISIFLLSKDYKRSIQYISSIDAASFEKDYMKSMYLNRLKALESESRLDTIHRNQFYNEGLFAIHSYMSKHPTDKEALYDYYFLKILFNDHTEVIKEIDSLRTQKIYNSSFLDALIEILNNFKE